MKITPTGAWALVLTVCVLAGCAPAGYIVIEDHSATTWSTLGNNLDHHFEEGTPYRTGLFIQLTSRNEAEYVFDQVVLQGSAGELALTPVLQGPNDQPDFHWINIVSGSGDPISPEQALYFYPSAAYEGMCADVDAQRGRTCECDQGDGTTVSVELDAGCLRRRRLHWQSEEVHGIVTYWQSNDGYKMTASQHPEKEHDRYLFSLMDDFRIDIYKYENGAFTKDQTYSSSDYKKIIIQARHDAAPGHGRNRDPSWPPETEP